MKDDSPIHVEERGQESPTITLSPRADSPNRVAVGTPPKNTQVSPFSTTSSALSPSFNEIKVQVPMRIQNLVQDIQSTSKVILGVGIDPDLAQWITNNLLPSLCWLGKDHLSSCISLGELQLDEIERHLIQLLDLQRGLLDSLVNTEEEGKPKLRKEIRRRIQQQNMLVFTLTKLVYSIMSDSVPEYQKQTLFIPREGMRCLSPIAPTIEADIDLSYHTLWLDASEYVLCVTLTVKGEASIHNCVATIANVNHLAGVTTVKTTHYTVKQQSECVTKIFFNTVQPRQQRKFLIIGKNINTAAFTIVLDEGGKIQPNGVRMHNRIIKFLSGKLGIRETDLAWVCCVPVKSPEGEDQTFVVLRVFHSRARSLVHTMKRQFNNKEYAPLHVVDVIDGIPPCALTDDAIHQPELVVNIVSTVSVKELGLLGSPKNEQDGGEEENREDAHSKKLSFTPIMQVERNWTADIYLVDGGPNDKTAVCEELFRQEAAGLFKQHGALGDWKQAIQGTYLLLERRYQSINHCPFVKELLYQIHLHSSNPDELRKIGDSVNKQYHCSGHHQLYTTMHKTPIYQQVTNLYMNMYILSSHLAASLQDYKFQIENEVSENVEDERQGRAHIVQEEKQSRSHLNASLQPLIQRISQLKEKMIKQQSLMSPPKRSFSANAVPHRSRSTTPSRSESKPLVRRLSASSAMSAASMDTARERKEMTRHIPAPKGRLSLPSQEAQRKVTKISFIREERRQPISVVAHKPRKISSETGSITSSIHAEDASDLDDSDSVPSSSRDTPNIHVPSLSDFKKSQSPPLLRRSPPLFPAETRKPKTTIAAGITNSVPPANKRLTPAKATAHPSIHSSLLTPRSSSASLTPQPRALYKGIVSPANSVDISPLRQPNPIGHPSVTSNFDSEMRMRFKEESSTRAEESVRTHRSSSGGGTTREQRKVEGEIKRVSERAQQVTASARMRIQQQQQQSMQQRVQASPHPSVRRDGATPKGSSHSHQVPRSSIPETPRQPISMPQTYTHFSPVNYGLLASPNVLMSRLVLMDGLN